MKRTNGFTLIELMICIAILAIGLAICVGAANARQVTDEYGHGVRCGQH